MTNKKTILIGGDLFGYGNIGDEAILESDILLFERDADIMVFTNDDRWLREEYPDVYPIVTKDIIESPYTIKGILGNIKKICINRKYYKKADLFLLGGGTSMSDFPWHSLGQVSIASMLGLPSIIWGAGYVKVTSKRAERFIKSVLNNAYVKSIYVRDKNAAERLYDIGVCRQKVDYCYDPVIVMEGSKYESDWYLTRNQQEILNNGKRNVVVCISGEREAQEKTELEQLIQLTRSMSELYNVWLIPTGFVNGCDDLMFLNEINNRAHNVNLIKMEFRPKHLIEFLKQCDVAITSRLHMSIFAVCAGTPFIALERSEKNKDFADIMGFQCLRLENLDIGKIQDIVKDIVIHQQELRQCIIDKRMCMRLRTIQMAKRVIEELEREG